MRVCDDVTLWLVVRDKKMKKTRRWVTDKVMESVWDRGEKVSCHRSKCTNDSVRQKACKCRVREGDISRIRKCDIQR